MGRTHVCSALMVKTLQHVNTWRRVFKMHVTDMDTQTNTLIEVIAFVPISIYRDRK